ncbi:hypothetical protein ACLI1A_08140 [Flavobacterium sp. RHBU_3]|uniref:hypothetical protein n=1 Tax=Flavobacterium sp. RHBU_3 TaxID=3391184 RepID=UPI003985560E
MKEKIEAVRREFDRKTGKITAFNLMKYPEESFGHQLGKFLLGSNYGQNVYAFPEDALQMLVTGKSTLTDEIALQYYLFGNGSLSLQVMATMCAGLAIMPWKLPHFYRMYRRGKSALRVYDIDHLGLLHLPVSRIKETFMIQ